MSLHRLVLTTQKLDGITGRGTSAMTAGDAFGLAISLLILVYLVYALFRGENL